LCHSHDLQWHGGHRGEEGGREGGREGWCGLSEAAVVTLLFSAIEVREGGSMKRQDDGKPDASMLHPRDQQQA